MENGAVIYLVVNFMVIDITVGFEECFLKNNIRSGRERIGGIVIYGLSIVWFIYLLFADKANDSLALLGILFII